MFWFQKKKNSPSIQDTGRHKPDHNLCSIPESIKKKKKDKRKGKERTESIKLSSDLRTNAMVHAHKHNVHKYIKGAGEMVQWLRTLAALEEDPGLVPIYMVVSIYLS